MRKLKNILLLLSIFIITVAFNFRDNPPSNWYQQFLPNVYSQQINDMTFLDSLTGFIVTSRNVNPDTATILKTTNGGDNWSVIFNSTPARLSRIKFINNNTGFASGKGGAEGFPALYKTTNQGLNWFQINADVGNIYWDDMSVLNQDTIWLVDKNSSNGGVYRTTNGGSSWQQQYSAGSQNPNKIYMFNARIGFISVPGTRVLKTTNSGINWSSIVEGQSIRDIHFIDSLNGWRASGINIYKTTNGGTNWITQYLPDGDDFVSTGLNEFSFIGDDKDTIWGAGGVINLGSGRFRGIVLKTTNGGTNWGYQIPDTSVNFPQYFHSQFLNYKTGWAYALTTGVHTKLGGDSTLTGVEPNITQIPNQFSLKQNYPNPFNPATIISFDIAKQSFVILRVYNIQGKEIANLINENKTAGKYNIVFDANAYSLTSGIYFYTMQVTASKESYTQTKKMILVK